MRIALSSYTGVGAWFVLRLLAEGHEVDYYLSKSEYDEVLSGIIPSPKMLSIDHRRTLKGFGYASYKGYDLSIFDLTGKAKQADSSRSDCPTFGDGSFECLLEDDREAGLSFMEKCEIKTPPYQRFDKSSEAKSFVRKQDKRYVFKPFTPSGSTQDTSTTYVSKDAEDMIKNLDNLCADAKGAPFVLQEYIKGTELSVEAWFNGTDFFNITCDLEEKKFMNDKKGPNTGCAGNLIFAIHEDMHIYKDTLLKAKSALQAVGFKGVIDVNSIVTEGRVYSLEWGPRFGYLCCPVFANMYGSGFGEFLHAIASGRTPNVKWSASFGAAITISIPPYPTEIRIPKAKDIPIEGIDPEDIEELLDYYLYDVKLNGKGLITSGNYGFVGAPIGIGDSITEAFIKCERLLERVQIPNIQYRTDIEKVCTEKFYTLEKDGWFS